MLSRLAATLTDDTVSGIEEDRASEGRERSTKQIERAWFWCAMHGYRPFLSWLSILVTGIGNRNHAISLMSLWPNRNHSAETPCAARRTSSMCLVGNAWIETLFELVVRTGNRHW